MRAGMPSRPIYSARRPWRMLAITLLLALLFGLAGMGEPLEDGLRVARNRILPVAASGDIVILKIDDESQTQLGRWPWPRLVHSQLVDRLTEANARKILLDFSVQFPMDRDQNRLFAEALQRSQRVVLPAHLVAGGGSGVERANSPLANLPLTARSG